jgi:hypothetical protein
MRTTLAVDIRTLIENLVTAVSVLGGAMAYESGLAARTAISENQAPDVLSQRVNEGLGAGFAWSPHRNLLSYHPRMDLIARTLSTPQGIYRLSWIVSSITAVSIIALGVPPVAIFVVAFGGLFALDPARNWARRRLGRDQAGP